MAHLCEKAIQYVPYLRRVAAKAGAKDMVEDAVQDALLVVLDLNPEQAEQVVNLRAYLAAITRYSAVSYRRNRGLGMTTGAGSGDQGAGAALIEARVFLHETWDNLTSEERAVVEALTDTGSQSAAARALGLRRQRVNRVLHRVRAKMGDA